MLTRVINVKVNLDIPNRIRQKSMLYQRKAFLWKFAIRFNLDKLKAI